VPAVVKLQDTIATPSTRIGAQESAGGQPGATLRVSGVIDSGGVPHGILIRNSGILRLTPTQPGTAFVRLKVMPE
jgi:hypothetical protein